ncbi:M20 aminoacylase family protein [Parvibium lacunae]|uniref:Amidohydrolase n=1 Tax=Parvibium lacunae TaxID=1888893 RepID=A0A368L4N5_9BURK|nr:M20 aminoacylase family protein [Parvibium lacunae]RCS58548.1 amidohydrolase [Parvibium lacunae]
MIDQTLVDRDILARAAAQARQDRRQIHAHPELAFAEHQTAALVARRLQAMGIEVFTGIGQTGVVGRLRCGESNKAIALRADMDALPLEEANQFPHRSVFTGRMHACGHDGHVAMLLAAADYLSQTKQFDGTVHFIFQPAEEGKGGAPAMLADGLFERFPSDAVYAMHNWPGLPVGQFAVNPGPMMASSNEFEIIVEGKGAHAAMPNLGIDPLFVACQIVLGLQSIITRNKRPIDAGVLSVTQIHAGDATNIIPNQARIAGTARGYQDEVIDLIESQMARIVDHTAQAYGAQATLCFKRNYPPTINHPAQAAWVAEVLAGLVGEQHVLTQIDPSMGAEDFSFMLQAKPGAYIWIGNGDGLHRAAGHGLGPCMLHNPSYDFNDDLIPLGAACWIKLVETYLDRS